MIREAEKRRPVPLKIQRDVALRQLAEMMTLLGMEPTRLELDHDPALILRPVDPETGEHIPHQHEPSCLIWRTAADHDRKTNGPGGERRITTAGSDKHKRDKIRDLSGAQAEFRRRLQAKDAGEAKPKSRWPSRPFNRKQRKPA